MRTRLDSEVATAQRAACSVGRDRRVRRDARNPVPDRLRMQFPRLMDAISATGASIFATGASIFAISVKFAKTRSFR